MLLYKTIIYVPVFTPGRNSWFYRLEESILKNERNTSLYRSLIAQTHSVCLTRVSLHVHNTHRHVHNTVYVHSRDKSPAFKRRYNLLHFLIVESNLLGY